MAGHRGQLLPLPLVVALLVVSIRPSHSRTLGCPTARGDGAGTTIIILAGQSNMAGRGGVVNNTWDNRLPPGFKPSESVQRFSADLKWEVAVDPLHQDIDASSVCGVGPGTTFATEVTRRRPGTRLGLVPCAISGTPIDQWANGTALYINMVGRTKAALQATPGASVGALLWFQGESDTHDINNARSYARKMEKLVADVRADLELPNLLVIQVALATGFEYLEEVRKQQMSVQLPNFYTVDGMGSELFPNEPIHLTTAGQVHVGTLLANAYLQATSHC